MATWARHHSAPVAEATAALFCTRALASLAGGSHRATNITMHIDATYALNIVCGHARASANAALIHRLRASLYVARSFFFISAFHVRSHTGNPGNEFADLAADLGAQGASSHPALQTLLSAAVVSTAPFINLHSAPFWQAVVEADDPHPEIDDGPAADGEPHSIHVTFVTANVTTTNPKAPLHGDPLETATASARRIGYLDQFASAHFDIIGLQETRSRARDRQSEGAYYTWASGANDGQGGCELWIRQSLIQDPTAAIVCHADSRLLIIRFPLGSGFALIVVAHAPTSGRPLEDRQSWWAATRAAIAQATRPGDSVVTLIDANARVGSITSDFVGEFAAAAETENGSELHHYLAETSTMLPATFELFTNGSVADAGTWRSHTGDWRRIDFVALPMDWAQGVTRAWCPADVHLCGGQYQDHRPAATRVAILQPAARINASRALPWDRRRLRDPTVAQQLAYEWDAVPDMPADWNGEFAEQNLTKLSRLLFARHCSPSTCAPRQHWIQPGSLEAIRWHAATRREFFAARRQASRSFLAIAFCGWLTASRMPWWTSHADRRIEQAHSFMRQAWTRTAFLGPSLALAAKQAAALIKHDREEWIQGLAARLEREAADGDHSGV